MGPLTGFTIGVTATRKALQQADALTSRGADVVLAPVLVESTSTTDLESLRTTTEAIIASPPDLFVATTTLGIGRWFDAAHQWGLGEALSEALSQAQILTRGPQTAEALQLHGLTVLWSPESETLDELMSVLRTWDLDGRHVVIQEHGHSMATSAQALRRLGAVVDLISTYRLSITDDIDPVFALIDQVADRTIDAVTFTSAPAVHAFIEIAAAAGRRDDVVAALRDDVVAVSIGDVTSSAAHSHGFPSVTPPQARLSELVRLLDTLLPQRRDGVRLEVAGHRLTWMGTWALIDGDEVNLSPASLAVLAALVANPGHVVSRQQLLAVLPQAASEHAVDMAVARLRAAIGPELVQTVVKRGYRLAVQR